MYPWVDSFLIDPFCIEQLNKPLNGGFLIHFEKLCICGLVGWSLQKRYIKKESTREYISLQRIMNLSSIWQEKKVHQGVEHADADKLMFQL